MKKTIYLANPYGFSTQQKRLVTPFIVSLESMGLEVYEPFQRNNQIDFAKAGWAFEVAKKDAEDVKHCDAILAIVNGTPPDEGVCIELGLAMAYGKQIFLFRDDFRKCSDSEEYPLNLMLFAGLPKDTWKNYFYTHVDELIDPKKALCRWANYTGTVLTKGPWL